MRGLKERLKERARELGLDPVGVAPATEADGFDRLRHWLADGFAGEMAYMERQAQARRHPASVLPAVRSVVMAGMSYAPSDRDGRTEETLASAGMGRVARYARGADYHDVLRARLKELLTWLRHEAPEAWGRAVVDTAPLLERDFARRAGLGWFGKNTMLLNKRLGSYVLLGALLLDIELEPDPPHQASHCGSCTACLEACPTDAFAGPYRLDSRRCISYLTIELRGPVPEEFRGALEGWLFGCDVCQQVCPWNRKALPGPERALAARADLERVDLVALLALTEGEFRQRFRGTALMRAGRSGLLRNAALLLGATGDDRAEAALRQATGDEDPVVRDAASWALAELRRRGANSATPAAAR